MRKWFEPVQTGLNQKCQQLQQASYDTPAQDVSDFIALGPRAIKSDTSLAGV